MKNACLKITRPIRWDRLTRFRAEPVFGRHAVFLDSAEKPVDLPDLAMLKGYRADGIRIVAPPLFALLETRDSRIV